MQCLCALVDFLVVMIFNNAAVWASVTSLISIFTSVNGNTESDAVMPVSAGANGL